MLVSFTIATLYLPMYVFVIPPMPVVCTYVISKRKAPASYFTHMPTIVLLLLLLLLLQINGFVSKTMHGWDRKDHVRAYFILLPPYSLSAMMDPRRNIRVLSLTVIKIAGPIM